VPRVVLVTGGSGALGQAITYRFLGEGAAWNHIAMEQAIQDSGLEPSDVSNIRTGIIMGSGGVTGLPYASGSEL